MTEVKLYSTVDNSLMALTNTAFYGGDRELLLNSFKAHPCKLMMGKII